jgi:hypothetical protein
MLRAGRSGFDSRQGQGIFFYRHAQTGSGAHPDSYPMSSGREADHSTHRVPRLRMREAVPPPPHASSRRYA